MDDRVVVIKTEVSFKEYMKLLYGLIYKKPIMIGLISVAVLLALWILCYHLSLFHLPEPKIYQYLGLLLIVVVQPFVVFYMLWRNYYSSNHLKEPLEVELTPDEIKIKAESFYLESCWNKMFEIKENKHWFLIYQNNMSAIILPKKSFAKNQIHNFKEILKGIREIPVKLLK